MAIPVEIHFNDPQIFVNAKIAFCYVVISVLISDKDTELIFCTTSWGQAIHLGSISISINIVKLINIVIILAIAIVISMLRFPQLNETLVIHVLHSMYD